MAFSTEKNISGKRFFFRGFHRFAIVTCLPGIDDGVKTEEETWRILDEMERQGVRKIWLTPHVMEDMSNKTVTLQQKFLSLKTKISREGGIGFGCGIYVG